MSRSVLVLVGGSLCLASGAAQVRAQDRDFSEVQIETIRLEGDLFMLVGSGGNIGLSVGADGAFVIDDQFAPLTEKILTAIGAVTDEPVRWVLNTHWHGDHTGGNENLGEAGAMIVAHRNVYRRMNPEAFSELVGRSAQQPAKALPVVTFDEGLEFHWNDRNIEVTHLSRAHTDGDAIVHFPEANVFHMGDTFFRDRFPFVDVGSGGGLDGVIEAANFVLSRADADTRIIPGHGSLSTPEDLRRYRDMLETVRLRVAALIAAGHSEEAVVAEDPAADLEGTWGGDSEAFIRAAFQSLSSG